ncbi:MAG: hypothetical protein KKD73_02175 [Proteobacteria bacterium]|nr:hypothetical protein [Pseudomonadota bacterium]MBU1640273.1 hypothetical protein [Pseudomonadota bacterium]
MKEERKDLLIILVVGILLVVAYVLSGIFMKQEPKSIDDELRPPVNRLEKIREGFVEK